MGCGRGELARALAAHFGQVRAVDPDAEMVRLAEDRLGPLRHVSVEQSSFLETDGGYDLVTMVAVLHHMDVAAALTHARQLLRPGGRLLIVGLSRMTSKSDLIWDTASAVLNPIIGLIKHPRVAAPMAGVPFPTAEPLLSFDELDVIAAQLLPGARLRRRLFFRHTLTWEQACDAPSVNK